MVQCDVPPDLLRVEHAFCDKASALLKTLEKLVHLNQLQYTNPARLSGGKNYFQFLCSGFYTVHVFHQLTEACRCKQYKRALSALIWQLSLTN